MAVAIESRYAAEVELRPGGRGAFEVKVDGKLVFSKTASGRFPEDEEVFAHLQ